MSTEAPEVNLDFQAYGEDNGIMRMVAIGGPSKHLVVLIEVFPTDEGLTLRVASDTKDEPKEALSGLTEFLESLVESLKEPKVVEGWDAQFKEGGA